MAEQPSTRVRRRPRRLRALSLVAAFVCVLVLGAPGTASAWTTGSLYPLVNCYYQNTDGSITVVLGYRSTYSSKQSIPVGSRNYITPSRYSSSLPTVFKPGTNDGVATMRVAALDVALTSWYLDGTTLSYWNVAYATPVCSPAQLPAFANGAALTAMLLAAGIVGALVVRRTRRSALTTRSNGSTHALGGDHA